VLNFLAGEKKSLMVPKFHTRRIGSVDIFELQGIVADPWVGRIREEMGQALEEDRPKGLLFNLREVERLDRSGAEAILETIRKPGKRAILGHNLSAYYVAEHMDPNEEIPIFEKEREAIGYFNRELAAEEAVNPPERRKFPRIKTALAAEVESKTYGESFYFEVAVTNLSEGGLYAEFLDSRTEELARRTLDPFDLKLLTVEIWLASEESVLVEGKVLRSETGVGKAPGMALEFYEVGEEDKTRLKRFLEEQK
jgi:hypothetical protein